jgi:Fe-S cluster assembly protein SufD
VRIDGAYLLADQRHADLTTVVDPRRPRRDSPTQLTKGVVRDAGARRFPGPHRASRGADGTDARMGHHALITVGQGRGRRQARAAEIYRRRRVQCAHGNTIGALDESGDLLHARQRGIPEADEARAMLTEAFVGEVVDRIGHEGARERGAGVGCRNSLGTAAMSAGPSIFPLIPAKARTQAFLVCLVRG